MASGQRWRGAYHRPREGGEPRLRVRRSHRERTVFVKPPNGRLRDGNSMTWPRHRGPLPPPYGDPFTLPRLMKRTRAITNITMLTSCTVPAIPARNGKPFDHGPPSTHAPRVMSSAPPIIRCGSTASLAPSPRNGFDERRRMGVGGGGAPRRFASSPGKRSMRFNKSRISSS